MEDAVKIEVKYLLNRKHLFPNMYLVGLLIFVVIIPWKFICTDYISMDWNKKYKLNKHRKDDWWN